LTIIRFEVKPPRLYGAARYVVLETTDGSVRLTMAEDQLVGGEWEPADEGLG
jgi:hypothetical protein